MSLPLRERGLKYRKIRGYIDGWCRSLCGSVDWNSERNHRFLIRFCRSLCGSVDWNLKCTKMVHIIFTSLPLRERGLKLYGWKTMKECENVAPFAGAWIEIYPYHSIMAPQVRRSLCGSVDWNPLNAIHAWVIGVAPFAGAWIEIVWGTLHALKYSVAPFEGAWIEILYALSTN